jgi:hypothetical protein
MTFANNVDFFPIIKPKTHLLSKNQSGMIKYRRSPTFIKAVIHQLGLLLTKFAKNNHALCTESGNKNKFT